MKLSRRSVLKGAAATGSVLALGCASTGASSATSGAASGSASTGKAATAAPGGGKKILILGGTGFLGPALVEAAQKRGHTLTLFNRGKTRPGLFPNVEKLHGDRDGHLEALAGRQWDAVIDTSGYVPRVVKQSVELLAPNVAHYVFISTISVYSDLSQPAREEGSPLEAVPDPKSEEVRKYYGGLKALCEQTVQAGVPGKAFVIRPGLIVGPDDPTDRFTYWPVRVAKGGEVLAPGNGTDPVQVIDVRDLAEWAIHGVEAKLLGIYNATGPGKTMTMRDMLEGCKKASGSNATFTWAPASFLEQQKVAPWSDMPAWFPAEGDMKAAGRISNAKALAEGLRFRPIEDTARDTLAWWKTQPEDRQAKLRAGLSPEREAEVLAALHKSGGAVDAKKAG